ncbi:hypothetical protein CEP52_005221 [Fusarium oligoseptatum]|uniref:Uncharacterized protein n=1 Tax=Fusarium oligoseptatum TaxID=2604345 RepID=A0A428TZF4_9HYPO|nr:hypothetical protein CEP52_005221 [Fusarium oligoseptatum]
MSTLKQWLARLVWWRKDAPRRKSRNRVCTKPYFPDLVDLDDENDTLQALEYKPEDTELPVIRTLGELQPNPGSFISLARQCLRCENILSDLEHSSSTVQIVKFTSAILRDSAITCELCFVILQGIAKHNCLGDTAGLTVKVDTNYAHIIVNANGKDIRFQSVPSTSSEDSSGGLFSTQRVKQELICGRRYGADGAPYLVAAVEDLPHPKLTDESRKLAQKVAPFHTSLGFPGEITLAEGRTFRIPGNVLGM